VHLLSGGGDKPKKKLLAAAVGIGVALAATPIAYADNNWIAMAISDSTGNISISDSGSATQGAASDHRTQFKTGRRVSWAQGVL